MFSILSVLFLLSVASAVPLSDFYAYGGNHGDQFLSSNDDGSTQAINLKVSFPFFGRDYGTIFVSCYLNNQCYSAF